MPLRINTTKLVDLIGEEFIDIKYGGAVAGEVPIGKIGKIGISILTKREDESEEVDEPGKHECVTMEPRVEIGEPAALPLFRSADEKPHRDQIPYYGDRYSVPVWLDIGRAARWDFRMNGWVDYGFACGCDPEDYDNELPEAGSRWFQLPKAERTVTEVVKVKAVPELKHINTVRPFKQPKTKGFDISPKGPERADGKRKPQIQDVFPAPKRGKYTVVPKAQHTNRRINANRGDAVRAAKKAGLVEGESANQRRARMSAQLRSVLPKKAKKGSR